MTIEFNFKHILCPIDFSDSSARSLAHAAALARWYESKLTVLHVAPMFDPVHMGKLDVPVVNPVPHDEVMADMRRTLDAPQALTDADLAVRTGDAPTSWSSSVFCVRWISPRRPSGHSMSR